MSPASGAYCGCDLTQAICFCIYGKIQGHLSGMGGESERFEDFTATTEPKNAIPLGLNPLYPQFSIICFELHFTAWTLQHIKAAHPNISKIFQDVFQERLHWGWMCRCVLMKVQRGFLLLWVRWWPCRRQSKPLHPQREAPEESLAIKVVRAPLPTPGLNRLPLRGSITTRGGVKSTESSWYKDLTILGYPLEVVCASNHSWWGRR